jgi:hypothetical protein
MRGTDNAVPVEPDEEGEGTGLEMVRADIVELCAGRRRAGEMVYRNS